MKKKSKILTLIILVVANVTLSGNLFSGRPELDLYYQYISRRNEFSSVVSWLVKDYIFSNCTTLNADTSKYLSWEQLVRSVDSLSYSYKYKYGLLTMGGYVEAKNNKAIISSVIENSPAAMAGLRPGDTIVGIESEPVQRISQLELDSVLQRKQGEVLKLKVNSSRGLFETKMQYDTFLPPNTILHKYLRKRILYIHFSMFDGSIASEIKSALKSMQQYATPVLILDLRNTTLGSIDHACDVAQLFLPIGRKICSIKRNKCIGDIDFVSQNQYPLKTKIVILINEYTSSGAEVLAAALRDNKKATIAGIKSRGNGTLYENYTVLTGEKIYLRSGFLFTSNGVAIEGNGVIPDLVIKNSDPLQDHALPDLKLQIPRTNDFQLQGILNIFTFMK